MAYYGVGGFLMPGQVPGDMIPVKDKTGNVIGFDYVTDTITKKGPISNEYKTVFIPAGSKTATAPAQPQAITRQSVDTSPQSVTQNKDTPATQTAPATTPASTTQSSQLTPTPAPMPVALEQAGRDTTGSVILGGGAGTGGGYQGVADAPLGAAGQDNQFLRRAGSLLLR